VKMIVFIRKNVEEQGRVCTHPEQRHWQQHQSA
jgi:ribosomal protein L39E